MSNNAAIDLTTVQEWISAKRDPKVIEEELLSNGLDAEAVSMHLKEYKRLRYAKRQNTGFICLGIGAMTGFISCVLTLTNPVPELYNVILYGLTSVAVTDRKSVV